MKYTKAHILKRTLIIVIIVSIWSTFGLVAYLGKNGYEHGRIAYKIATDNCSTWGLMEAVPSPIEAKKDLMFRATWTQILGPISFIVVCYQSGLFHYGYRWDIGIGELNEAIQKSRGKPKEHEGWIIIPPEIYKSNAEERKIPI